MLNWYLVYTKPKQEQIALLNLERQGFSCFLPMFSVERIRQKVLSKVKEPLFSRYLFIELDTSISGRGWGSIRSTIGVSHLVTFGHIPARVDDEIIATIRAHESSEMPSQKLFVPGERLKITQGPFVGIEAVYQMADGNQRALVLIELLNKPTKLRVDINNIRKLG